MLSIDFIVLRSKNLAAMTAFYSTLGLEFQEQKHGNGPTHFAANLDGSILEIYPLGEHGSPTSGLYLGLSVSGLDSILETLGDGCVRSRNSDTTGKQAVIVDPEGHVLQLTESARGF